MSLPERISGLMLRYMYQWKIDGKLTSPSEQDIQDTLDRAVEALYDKDPGDQLEVGRLIIKKRDNQIHDVFILAGTIGEDND